MRLRESQNTTPYRNREQVVGQNKGAVAAVITAVFHTDPLLPGRNSLIIQWKTAIMGVD